MAIDFATKELPDTILKVGATTDVDGVGGLDGDFQNATDNFTAPLTDGALATKSYVDSEIAGVGNVTTAIAAGNSKFLHRFTDNTADLVDGNLENPAVILALRPLFFDTTAANPLFIGSYINPNFPNTQVDFEWDTVNQQFTLFHAGTAETVDIKVTNHSRINGNTLITPHSAYTLGIGEQTYLSPGGGFDLNFNLETDGDQILTDTTLTMHITAAPQLETVSLGIKCLRVANVINPTVWLRTDFSDTTSN